MSPPGPTPQTLLTDDPAGDLASARAEVLHVFEQDGLADAAYRIIHGQFTEEQRQGVFKPEVPVPTDATAQQRLLAYTGRDPA